MMNNNTMEESELLHASRNGDITTIKALLDRKNSGEIELDINCLGKTKANNSWTPLHLASYFGHRDVVQLLLENGADVNAINDIGDSPLHRAAFTGRQDIVTLLLQHHADVNLLNAEGNSPRQVARTLDIKKFIEAAEITEKRKTEEGFRKAARDGDIEILTTLLKSGHPLNVNCVDTYGNSALHWASTRGRKEVVVLLLQNGVDTSIRNSQGQTALDLATDPRMRLLLDVKSISDVKKNNIHRHEGTLFKKVRLLGWKQVWVLLERGVVSIFSTRGDASAGANRKLYRYLDGAKVQAKPHIAHVFSLNFSDGSVMWLSVGAGNSAELIRLKWENAFKEHIRYSDNLVKLDGQALRDDKEDDNVVLPLGSLQDTFQTAQAHQQIIESQVTQITADISHMNSNGTRSSVEKVGSLDIHDQFQQLVESSKEMLSSLSHCLSIFTQQEHVRKVELEDERERSRILQESLHVLAQEHLALEKSIVFGSPTSFSASEVDEFFDCEDAADCNDDDDDSFDSSNEKAATVADSFRELASLESSSNSCQLRTTAELDLGKSVWGGRCRLPVPAFARTFSVWNFLKQCIGKELSKITMPIVLNEPLSFLQRTVEYLEYTDLIKQASDCDDPVKRLEFVSAFAVSACASNWERIGKPFNPILGETYELSRDDLGFRVICEQVSHHPPVSALHAESSYFTFSNSVQPKLKFWGKSVEVQPIGKSILYLQRHDEAYSWQNVNCCVHNIIVGKIWIENYGTMELTNLKTGFRSVLQFRTKEWFSPEVHKVDGFIFDDNPRPYSLQVGQHCHSHKYLIICEQMVANMSNGIFQRRNIVAELVHRDRLGRLVIDYHFLGNKLRALYGKWTEALFSCGVAEWEKYQANPHPTPKADSVISNGEDFSLSSCQALDGSRSSTPLNGLQNSFYNLYLPSQELLWSAMPKPSDTSKYFNFTLFAMILNELDDEMKATLPPTDCRLRPDIRRMEDGDIDGAADEKNRLEEKQRAARKARNGDGSWKPRWFEQKLNHLSNKEDWVFTGEYWKRDWSKCPDIF